MRARIAEMAPMGAKDSGDIHVAGLKCHVYTTASSLEPRGFWFHYHSIVPAVPWNRGAFDSITTVSSPQSHGTAGLLIPLPQYLPHSAVEPQGFWFHYHSIIPAVPWNRLAFDSITTVSSPQCRGTAGLLIPLPQYRPRSAVEPQGFWFHYHSIVPAVPWNRLAFDSITTVSSPQCRGTAGLLIPLPQYRPRSAMEPQGFSFHHHSIVPSVLWNHGVFASITTVFSPQCSGTAGLLIPLPQYRPRSAVEPQGFWFHYHSIVPVVPWNRRAFDSITTVSSLQCRGTAGLWFHYHSIIPAVPWNRRAFDSITTV